ncbi:hypothetical protein M8C21_025643 [Ambrosia artemisiifolia]|uniref:NPH3 domain-containing protein n=1 Tax=Ambrosia artemisiifolia TaxID=4212 RepID=A0AAD5GNW5_AMBAR|nr:hypothetical protein M8C21_025643 [Ambrosia artemisiifolia]
MSLSLNLRSNERSKLESVLGSRLDEFTINDLLVRGKKKAAFDVDLILQLLKSFLLERRIKGSFVHRVKKVGLLMDLFMLEVAADPFLKHSKFLALAIALPAIARESHDRLYRAIDLYVEVHRGLSEEQSAMLWSVLDLNKLSMVRTKLNLTRNGNRRHLPFVKQKRFKECINDDFRVHGKQGSEVTPRLMPKKSRTIDPCNAKSLPRLCH